MSELSDVEELALANKRYRWILNYKPWEFLKKAGTGTQSTTVPYIALPSDFKYFTENGNFTDNTRQVDNNASPKVVFVGPSYAPYQIINFSDRRQYRDKDGYAYADLVNSRLYFTKQPTTANTVEFDYIYKPDDLTLATAPVFHSDFHPMIYHGMAVEDNILQLFEKARSYKNENQTLHDNYLKDLCYYNSQFFNN